MNAKKKRTSVQIAYKILKREKRAMKSGEIINIAFDEFGRFMKGKTPSATLTSNFINEIKRRQKSNKAQRFVRVSRGKWGLAEYIGVYYDIKE